MKLSWIKDVLVSMFIVVPLARGLIVSLFPSCSLVLQGASMETTGGEGGHRVNGEREEKDD